MDEKTSFVVYCIEQYKTAKNLKGREVIDLFNQYQLIGYIRDFYESLHTTGRQYIVEDIGQYIESQGKRA